MSSSPIFKFSKRLKTIWQNFSLPNPAYFYPYDRKSEAECDR